MEEVPYCIINCKKWSYDPTASRIVIKYTISEDEKENRFSILLYNDKVILKHNCHEKFDVVHVSDYCMVYKRDL